MYPRVEGVDILHRYPRVGKVDILQWGGYISYTREDIYPTVEGVDILDYGATCPTVERGDKDHTFGGVAILP